MKHKLKRIIELNNTLKEMNVSLSVRIGIIKCKCKHNEL